MAVTAGCSVFNPAESMAVGFFGGVIAILAEAILEKIKIDDPVGAAPVHMFPSAWGVLAVGLFGSSTYGELPYHTGVLHGGGFKLLGIQMLGTGALILWSLIASYLTFKTIQLTIGLRFDKKDEILGADWVEHHVRSENFAMKMEKALIAMNIGREYESDLAAKVSLMLTPNFSIIIDHHHHSSLGYTRTRISEQR